MSTAGAVSTGGGAPQSTGGAPASTGGAPASTGAAAFTWGESWRQHLASGSTDPDKELKRLERFEAPDGIYKSYRELEGRMSRGELRTTLRPNASVAEVAQWRKENGIPEKPEEYKVNLPAGRAMPKDDDGFVKAFMKSAHENNYSQAQVDGALAAFYGEVDRSEQALKENEAKLERETEDKLRQEWQGDYRVNKAMADALLSRAPAGFAERFKSGYLADGTPIKASVDAWKWLVQMEREINPASTVVPGQAGDVTKTIAAELDGLKKLMADPKSEYWKGAKAAANQERYRQLLVAEEKLKAKA